MIRNLTLINLEHDVELPSSPDASVFFIKTCQRQIIVGFGKTPYHFYDPENAPAGKVKDFLMGHDAYSFLLKTICGLKSRLVGENEIVGQFRQAFKLFMDGENRDNALIPIFEKLLKDGKEVRTHYLRDISQLSYSGLAKQCLQRKIKNGPVVVLGSGQLAADLIKALGKKYPVILCARNQDRVQELIKKDHVTALPFDSLIDVYQYAAIINTIPCQNPLITQDKINIWKKNPQESRLFIDLASPTVFDAEVQLDSSIKLLADLFDLRENISNLKDKKVESALKAIKEISAKRYDYFKLNFPLSREESKFA
jgi:glutamyl-tRNA reductase